ncbi:hypothetical protein M9H77_34781 [Catharanthus roseus]|uniref:Uncharacterized protein n=1 Tax=Catharanthus roseus TaxID=4058 RepID=A0ACB9ZPN9_CATRO|nr:hypothetical protein M9H77_34781 [Catharanthus roseus]
MKGSSAVGKSERIQTHQRSLYTRIQKNMLQIPEAPTRSVLGPTLVSKHTAVPTRPIEPHPPRYYAPLRVDPLSESETSKSLEEALVRETSHVQCNPLTLSNT